MNIKNEADSIIKNSDTSCLVSLPQGEGLVFIVTHTEAGKLQSTEPSVQNNVYLSHDSTMTRNKENDFPIIKTRVPA